MRKTEDLGKDGGGMVGDSGGECSGAPSMGTRMMRGCQRKETQIPT